MELLFTFRTVKSYSRLFQLDVDGCMRAKDGVKVMVLITKKKLYMEYKTF